MKNKYKLAIGVVVLILLILLFFKFPDISSAVRNRTHVDVFDAHVRVGDYVGFNNTNESFEFGTLNTMGGAGKKVTVKNEFDDARRVRFSSTGDIAPFIGVSENLFVLEPGEENVIEVTIYVPKGTELGEYDGEVKIDYIPL